MNAEENAARAIGSFVRSYGGDEGIVEKVIGLHMQCHHRVATVEIRRADGSVFQEYLHDTYSPVVKILFLDDDGHKVGDLKVENRWNKDNPCFGMNDIEIVEWSKDNTELGRAGFKPQLFPECARERND